MAVASYIMLGVTCWYRLAVMVMSFVPKNLGDNLHRNTRQEGQGGERVLRSCSRMRRSPTLRRRDRNAFETAAGCSGSPNTCVNTGFLEVHVSPLHAQQFPPRHTRSGREEEDGT